MAAVSSRSSGRIDVHAHALPPFYVDAVTATGHKTSVSGGFPAWTPEAALAFMDRNDIGISINSISPPGVHFGDETKAVALARRCNDYLAELNSRYPTRFVHWDPAAASVPASLSELEHICGTLKLDGAVLFASYGNAFLGDPVFDPILERLNDANAVVFIHPNSHPSSIALADAHPHVPRRFPLATTRTVANLIFTAPLEHFPDVKFILRTTAGRCRTSGWRFAMAPLVDARVEGFSPEGVLATLKRFCFESAQAAGPGVMAALAGPRIRIGGCSGPTGRIVRKPSPPPVTARSFPRRPGTDFEPMPCTCSRALMC